MTMLLRSFLKQSLLPPFLIVWMLVVGIVFKHSLGWVAWLALIILYLLSVSPVANILARGLEFFPPVDLEACQQADAIVVLGSGRPRSSPELPGYQPTSMGLERIRYAALLYRRCPIPVLVTGGGDRPESQVMANVLKEDYGVEVTWIESESLTTWQNALFSREKLGADKRTVVLVTHAWHMPRAVLSFKRAGFDVIPAPTAFTWNQKHWGKPTYWIPRVRNLRVSELAIHEYLGLGWYWLTSRT